MNRLITIPLLFILLIISNLPAQNQNEKGIIAGNKSLQIYLVKQQWHTGIIFPVKEVNPKVWPEILQFKKFKYIDAGWGDAAFYQHPDFNLKLAAEALLYPTPSTLRINGFSMPINKYAEYCDVAIELHLDRSDFDLLCEYVHNSYSRNSKGKIQILNYTAGGTVIFYKAEGKYDIFNTCNTWVAKGLLTAGFKSFSESTILAEELFKDAAKEGTVIKSHTSN